MVDTKRTRQNAAAGKENQTAPSQSSARGRASKRRAEKAKPSATEAAASASDSAPPAKVAKKDGATTAGSEANPESPTTSASNEAATEKESAESPDEVLAEGDNGVHGGAQHQALGALNQEVDRIIGCAQHQGELVFLVQWKNSDGEAQVVPASFLNIKFPQEVISFYEQRIIWDDELSG